MKREKYIVLGMITAIAVLAACLNKDIEFTVTTVIGYILMIAISFAKYEWIEKKRYWIVGAWALSFALIVFIPIEIPAKYVSAEILVLLFLPLVATLLEKFRWKKTAWIVVGIYAIVQTLVRPVIHWEIFISRKGDAAYIYDQIYKFVHGSKFIGKSELAGELASYLPEAKTGTILTAYGVEYGNIMKMIVCVMLAALVGKVLLDMLRNKSRGYLCAIGCVLAIGIESLVVILQNIPAIPYKELETFLPFFSNSIGGLITCYIMMGLVLCAYNSKDVNDESNI